MNQVSIKVHEPAVNTSNKQVQTPDELLPLLVNDETEYETDKDNITSNLFPDPAEFVPQSPDFSFPPLPPTPPELDETETITSSTILKTAIEVLPAKLNEKKKDSDKKETKKVAIRENKTQEKESKKKEENIEKGDTKKQKSEKSEKKERTSILVDKKNKHSNMEKKRHKKETFHHLKVPQVQLQVSSEREIVDSIVVIQNKEKKKEERLARKSKRRKEKREQEYDHQHQQHLLDCNECQEDRVRKKREREMIRSDDIGYLFYSDIGMVNNKE